MATLKSGVHCGHQDIELDELRALWRKVDADGFDMVTYCKHHEALKSYAEDVTPAFR